MTALVWSMQRWYRPKQRRQSSYRAALAAPTFVNVCWPETCLAAQWRQETLVVSCLGRT